LTKCNFKTILYNEYDYSNEYTNLNKTNWKLRSGFYFNDNKILKEHHNNDSENEEEQTVDSIKKHKEIESIG